MRLITLIVPAALGAMVALLAPHAEAQTMGEYATTVGVGAGSGSMSTSISSSIGSSDLGGGSSTWGVSGVGASFEERAGAASGSSLGADFESRAGSGGQSAQSRWPQSRFNEESSRFDTSSRFSGQDRFAEQNTLSSSADRFPPSAFSNSSSGLDTRYNALNNY